MTELDTSLAAVCDRQEKLVRALFKGASLRRAWQQAGYSTGHHASLARILQMPGVRDNILWRLRRGDKLRGKLHSEVVRRLGLVPVEPVDPLPDVFELSELL